MPVAAPSCGGVLLLVTPTQSSTSSPLVSPHSSLVEKTTVFLYLLLLLLLLLFLAAAELFREKLERFLFHHEASWRKMRTARIVPPDALVVRTTSDRCRLFQTLKA